MASRNVVQKRGEREPTFAEWHAVLTSIVGDEPKVVQQTIEYFLRTSKSGRAYLEGAQRLRPNLKIGKNLELDEVIATYDAMDLVSKLVAEPRCGTDPEFSVWKDIWKDPSVGASELYGMAIEISQVLEERSRNEAEKARLQQIRTVLENELHLEGRASRAQKDAPRGKSLAKAAAGHIDEPQTPLGQELKRILAHLEKPGALPDTKPAPDFDWVHFMSWHPAFRNIFS